jgi:hypothetical protein
VGLFFLWRYSHSRDPAAGLTYLVMTLPLVVIWFGPLSHLGAHVFRLAIDPEDKRSFDPSAEKRVLDGIAELIRTGKKDEAIRVCESLKDSGVVNDATLKLTLEHLGVPQTGGRYLSPMVEVDRLRTAGKLAEAEIVLQSLLLKNPADFDAAMMLMRLYAENLRQPLSAELVLRTLKQQPNINPAHLEFARRSVAEWSRPGGMKPESVEEPPPAAKSVEELLAGRFYGTAVEVLQEQVKAQPQDYDLRLKLAEVQAVHCRNLPAAEKVVKQMAGIFSREQVEQAENRLKEWRGEGR